MFIVSKALISFKNYKDMSIAKEKSKNFGEGRDFA